jgi:hypothetical protein
MGWSSYCPEKSKVLGWQYRRAAAAAPQTAAVASQPPGYYDKDIPTSLSRWAGWLYQDE